MSILNIFVQYMNVNTSVTSVTYFLKVSGNNIANAKIYIFAHFTHTSNLPKKKNWNSFRMFYIWFLDSSLLVIVGNFSRMKHY